MNYENTISVYSNCLKPLPGGSITVIDFCLDVINGGCKTEVEAVRKANDKAARTEIKKSLPAVTVSGTFTERNKTGLIQHSGFIAIDIDANDNPSITNWNEVRDKVAKIANVFFVALSVSGNGVFVLIPITNPTKHEQHFDGLKIAFRAIGISIDGSCRDVSRLRFVSYDPDGRLNINAKPFGKIYTPPPPKVDRRPIRHAASDNLAIMIDKIIASGVDITDGYENWFSIGRALANELGEGGRTAFHRISQVYAKYNPQRCDRKFNDCLKSPGNATKATIFHLAKEYGIMLKAN